MTAVDPPASDPPVYVATAYRWGQLNNHTYTVFAGIRRDEALRMAEEEVSGRGGKYGVVVVEFPSEKMVADFPSGGESADAKAPYQSATIDAGSMAGSELLMSICLGSITRAAAAEPEVPSEPVSVPPDVPEWLKHLCWQKLKMARKMGV